MPALLIVMNNIKIEKTVKVTTRVQQEIDDIRYWQTRSPAERLEALTLLVKQFLEFHPDVPRRLQRVVKITARKKDLIFARWRVCFSFSWISAEYR